MSALPRKQIQADRLAAIAKVQVTYAAASGMRTAQVIGPPDQQKLLGKAPFMH